MTDTNLEKIIKNPQFWENVEDTVEQQEHRSDADNEVRAAGTILKFVNECDQEE